MGNSASKDGSSGSRTLVRRAHEDHSDSTTSPITQQPSADRLTVVYGAGASSSRRSSRPDIPFLHLSRDRSEQQQPKQRETRQEREARRAERERQARLKERERSVKEESVDGGFLVTLGTYTGPEDFSKAVVRQLQIERRLAPFWKGLNDHSDSWTEHQLVAAVRGLPIPAADAIPTEVPRSSSQASAPWQAGDSTTGSLLPDSTAQLSTSNPAPSSISLSPLASSPLFRSRSKTLASITGAKPTSSESLPQEIRLPNDPYINGLPIEAYLYREPGECPICFLYYPPYLNKTRCCDQAICSECFVQIKRPDPHLPEHEQPGQTRSPEEEAGLLVSEVASCPFCVAPEFGITYDPPQFRRGLVYANYLAKTGKDLSATSSQSSFQSGERRRTISISASAPEVVTTDRVRPDWAKKLADARAHALRRSAAATALHNAAYVLGSEDLFTRGYGRRRRSIFADSPGTSGNHTPREGGDAIADLLPGRGSSRRNRVDDLEDLMMMEAIRLSLAAEEERKKKEDKEKAKDDKKKAKEAKKEQKQLEKLAKKSNGSSSSIYKLPSNDSASTWASTSMARSTSNLGSQPIPEEDVSGKGKGPALQIPAASLSEPFLPAGASSTSQSDSQRHLEESRANIQPAASNPIPMPGRRHHPRQLSNASSIASSIDSPTASYRAESPLPGSTFDMLPESAEDGSLTSGTPAADAAGGLEPLLNFQSLAAMIGKENAKSGSDHVENLLVAESPTSGQGQVDDASSSHVGQDAIDEKAGLSEHQNDATVVADGDKKSNTEAGILPESNTTLSKGDRKNSADVHVHEQKQYHEPTQ